MAATADRSTLTLQGADQVMAAAMAFAAEQGWAATVCVADGAGVPLLVRRSDGAWPASVEIDHPVGRAVEDEDGRRHIGQAPQALKPVL